MIKESELEIMLFIKNFFKRAASAPEKKVLFENFFSLSFLQAADYFFSLITLPYLVRILGPERFGLVAFAWAFIQYFVILADYGFDLSATREISMNRENKEKITKVFNTVLLIKLCFLALSFLVLTGLVFFVPRFRGEWIIYIFTFGIVIGKTLLPIWFFQGMERMKYITFLTITAKFIFTISIFVFIKTAHDYIYVPLLNSMGFLIAGILGLWIAYKDFKIKITLPGFEDIAHQLKEGWHIFISTLSISLYTTSNAFILGIFTNNAVVGYYSAAERLIWAFQKLLIPTSQTIYPYINKLVVESKGKALHFIRKILIFIGSGNLIISLAIFILAAPIINVVFGQEYHESIIVLRILAFLPFTVSLSNIFGIQIMLTFNHKKAFSRILVSAGILNISLALLSVQFYKHIGISVSALITEIFITIAMFLYLKQKEQASFRYILTGEIKWKEAV